MQGNTKFYSIKTTYTTLVSLAVCMLAISFCTKEAYSRQPQNDRPAHVSSLTDTAKILQLIDNAKRLKHQQPDSSIAYFEQAYQASRPIDYVSGSIYPLLQMGDIYAARGEYDKAQTLVLQAVSNSLQINGGNFYFGTIYNEIGNLYEMQGKTDLALKYYLQAIVYVEKNPSYTSPGMIYNNVAAIMILTGQNEKALFYLSKAEKIATDEKDYSLLGNIAQRKGIIYGEEKTGC